MAHVGKFYKLQFRRDLAQVPNHAQGWPEAFRYSQSNTSGAIAADAINNVVPLINLAKNSQPPMIWLSDIRTVGGIPYRMRITIADPLNSDKPDFKFEVFNSTTLANIFNFSKAPGTVAYGPSGTHGSEAGTFADSTNWKIVGGGFLWNTAALPWSLYNP